MWAVLIIVGILSFVIGQVGYKKGWFRGSNPPLIRKSLMGLGIVMAIIGILSTSFLIVPTQHTAHLVKKYGNELENGRVIAVNGERGRQSDLLQEGLNISLFVRVLYDIEFVSYEKIGEGQVGLLTAVDGSPLGQDLFIAPDWITLFSDTVQVRVNDSTTYDSIVYEDRPIVETKMLDPKYFIENGGKKGPQLNVLTPGEYKINKYQWKVEIVEATRIPDGHVGVIISRVGKVPKDIEIESEGKTLATPVVDRGYMGIWKDVLKPGMYYLNRHPDKNKGAYEVKLVDTRVQTWTYKGGYSWYTIDLTINEDGKITQTKSNDQFEKTPDGSADDAIQARSMDGWDIYVDGRILVQAQPMDAPYIVASVGGLEELENKIVTPLIRSVIRNIAESREAPQFVFERSKIETAIDATLKLKGMGSWLTIKEFKMNNVYIKPELLVPDKRKQLANKMTETYKQEKLAYDEKVRTEKAREEASQQGTLVKAKIADQAADLYASAERKKGIGTRDRMLEEAKGQSALRDVFGNEKSFALEMMNKIQTLPASAFQVPFSYSVNGGSGSGGSDPFAFINLNHMIRSAKEMGIDPSTYALPAVEEEINSYNDIKVKTTPPIEPIEPTN